jgi:hypothetical protein
VRAAAVLVQTVRVLLATKPEPGAQVVAAQVALGTTQQLSLPQQKAQSIQAAVVVALVSVTALELQAAPASSSFATLVRNVVLVVL